MGIFVALFICIYLAELGKPRLRFVILCINLKYESSAYLFCIVFYMLRRSEQKNVTFQSKTWGKMRSYPSLCKNEINSHPGIICSGIRLKYDIGWFVKMRAECAKSHFPSIFSLKNTERKADRVEI